MDHDQCRKYKILSIATDKKNICEEMEEIERETNLKASNTFVNILKHFSVSNIENLAFDDRIEMKDEPNAKFINVDVVCVPWPSLSLTKRKSPTFVITTIPPTIVA
jgi:hypothetical protein